MVSGSVVISSLELYATLDAGFYPTVLWDSPKYYLITMYVCVLKLVTRQRTDESDRCERRASSFSIFNLLHFMRSLSKWMCYAQQIVMVVRRKRCSMNSITERFYTAQFYGFELCSKSMIFLARKTRSCEWENQNAKHFQCSTNDHYCWLNPHSCCLLHSWIWPLQIRTISSQ